MNDEEIRILSGGTNNICFADKDRHCSKDCKAYQSDAELRETFVALIAGENCEILNSLYVIATALTKIERR